MPSVSHSCADRAWILSLAFCRHSAAFSVNSAGVCSLIMNISLTGGCPAAGLSSLLLSLPLGWTARGISTVSPSHPPPPHSPPLPGTPPPRVLVRLCHSAGSLTRTACAPSALQNGPLRSPKLPSCSLTEQWTPAHPSLIPALHPAGHRWPARPPEMPVRPPPRASPLCRPAPAPFLQQASGPPAFGGVPALTWRSKASNFQASPPHTDVSGNPGYPQRMLLPRAHFFHLLAGSPMLGLQPQEFPR